MLDKYGIGCDIENIERFEKVSSHFCSRIFTPDEISYCFSKGKPSSHLAARFCGKEAVMKALGSLGINGIYYKDIAIYKAKNGAPCAKIIGREKAFDIKISLSHGKESAIAYALVEKLD